jgi:hypothetical protein
LKEPPGDEAFADENAGEEKEDADKTLTDEFLGDAEEFEDDRQEADALVLYLLGQRMGR